LVGAPESEIDKLDFIGQVVNPTVIGSWIRTSDKGGLDGGWFFPVEVDIDLALQLEEDSETKKLLLDFLSNNNITKCIFLSRDMGANPPQHTKIRVIVPGDTYEQKMSIVINAFDYFGMQFFPDKALEIMRNKDDMLMDIVLSSAGIVQLSLLFPNPDSKVLNKVYINSEVFLKIQKCLGNVEPVLIEYQHLEKRIWLWCIQRRI